MQSHQAGARQLLAHVPIVTSEGKLTGALGDRGMRQLRDEGHILSGIEIGMVPFGKFMEAC